MDKMQNSITIYGEFVRDPYAHHMHDGITIYCSYFRCVMTTGTEYEYRVLFPDMLRDSVQLHKKYKITGFIESHNRLVGGKARVYISVYLQKLEVLEDLPNIERCHVKLSGAIVSTPNFHEYNGKAYCHLTIASDRNGATSDYIPCVSYYDSAKYLGKLGVGDVVSVVGRLQSRSFTKTLEDGSKVNRVAYEVAVRNPQYMGNNRKTRKNRSKAS